MKQLIILLVEDNPDDQVFSRMAIKKSGIDAEVIVAGSGEEAIDYVKRQGKFKTRKRSDIPDVVFLDVHLGTITGFDVLREIRNSVDLGLVPVFMFSTSALESDVVRAYKAGANGYLQKAMSLVGMEERAKIVLGFCLMNITVRSASSK